MSRRHMATRWDEDNCHSQCAKCNTFNQGEQYKYALFLNKKFDTDKASELLVKSRQTVKLSLEDLLDKIEFYKKKLE